MHASENMKQNMIKIFESRNDDQVHGPWTNKELGISSAPGFAGIDPHHTCV